MALQDAQFRGSCSLKTVVLLIILAATMLLPTLLLTHFLIHRVTPAAASSYQGQSTLGSEPPDDWEKYVRSPPKNIVYPVAIVSNYTQGNVTNPDGLITGHGPTTLSRSVPATANSTTDIVPTIVVDFGQNIAGFLSIQFGGAHNSTPGFPGIRLAFSETLEFLTNVSDFSRSDNLQPGDVSSPTHY